MSLHFRITRHWMAPLALAIIALTAGCGGGDDFPCEIDCPKENIPPGCTVIRATHDIASQQVIVLVGAWDEDQTLVAGGLGLTFEIAAAGVTYTNDVVSSTTGSPVGPGVVGAAAGVASPGEETEVRISLVMPEVIPEVPDALITVTVVDGEGAISTCTIDVNLEIPATEPACQITAPPTGSCIDVMGTGGLLDVGVTLTDPESDAIDVSVCYQVGAGPMLPATLIAASAGVPTGFTPTHPDACTGPSNQIIDVPPGALTVTWDVAADGIGLTTCEDVTVWVSPEDGTTEGDGPFSSCSRTLQVSNNGAPSCTIDRFNEEAIGFTVIDADSPLVSVTYEYSTDGGAIYSLATPLAPSANPETVAPGPGHTFFWDWMTDIPACTMVTFRITVDDGVPLPNRPAFCTATAELGCVELLPPSCTITLLDDTGPTYDAADLDSPTLQATYEYSTDGGATFSSATPIAPSANPQSVSPGTGLVYNWDSMADIGDCFQGVVFRITVDDGETVPASCTAVANILCDLPVAPACIIRSLDDIVGPAGGLLEAIYDVIDPDSLGLTVTFDYSVDGGATFLPATPGGTSTNPATVDPAAGLTFTWNSLPDVPECTLNVVFQITVDDGLNPPATCTFTRDVNCFPTEPSCTITRPTAGCLDLQGTGGLVDIDIDLFDPEGDPINFSLCYDVGGGQLPATLTATTGGSLGPYSPTNAAACVGAANQVTGAASGSVTVTWDARTDGLGLTGCEPVTIWVYPEDGTTSGFGPFTSCSAQFEVSDNAPPSCVIITADAQGISFDVFDPDSDPISIVAEYSTDGGATWTLFPSGGPTANPTSESPGTGFFMSWDGCVEVPMGGPVDIRVTVDDGIPLPDRPAFCTEVALFGC